jgi:glyoxylase-like metal-dependent hydrolase (beta-lactamase superfamily II)
MASLYCDVAYTACGPRPVSTLVRRLVATDVAARDLAGLRTYIVGHGDVAVIDPGPMSRPLIEAVMTATAGETITHVIVTHGHGRRQPAAEALATLTGAQILTAQAGLTHGARIEAAGWTITAWATPGHAPDHMALALHEENALLCGDLVSGFAPDLVTPPGGSLIDHLISLDTVRRRRFARLFPSHGPVVERPEAFLETCLGACAARDRRILTSLALFGPASAAKLAARLDHGYGGLPGPAAALALLAHLEWLAVQGAVVGASHPSIATTFALAPPAAAWRRATLSPARRAA